MQICMSMCQAAAAYRHVGVCMCVSGSRQPVPFKFVCAHLQQRLCLRLLVARILGRVAQCARQVGIAPRAPSAYVNACRHSVRASTCIGSLQAAVAAAAVAAAVAAAAAKEWVAEGVEREIAHKGGHEWGLWYGERTCSPVQCARLLPKVHLCSLMCMPAFCTCGSLAAYTRLFPNLYACLAHAAAWLHTRACSRRCLTACLQAVAGRGVLVRMLGCNQCTNRTTAGTRIGAHTHT